MKLVREHINEKFTEDSDPIKDMGIGLITKLKQEYISSHWLYVQPKKSKGFPWNKYQAPSQRHPTEDEVTLDMLFDYCLRDRTGKYGISVVEALIDAGADVNMSYSFQSPFYIAINKGIDYVKLFISKVDKIKDLNRLCYTAILEKKLDIAELFVKAGADIKFQGNICIRSASKYNLTDSVKWLLDKGANPNVLDYYCLQQALRNKNYELTDIFFKEYEKSHKK
jgi:hypothetical protein